MAFSANAEQEWLDLARTLMLRGKYVEAESTALQALRKYPRSFELRRLLAGVCMQTGHQPNAEALLVELSTERPRDAGVMFALARMLIAQSRSGAAAAAIRSFFEHPSHDTELVIQAVELLDACNHARDAEAIVERAIQAIPDEARLHAYAGMLELKLGEFRRAREHYLFALDHAPQACEWHIPHGIAQMQRYHDAQHPDFVRFHDYLTRGNLSDKARSTLLFALAKANDDIGDFAEAAAHSRQANAIAHATTKWTRKQWRRAVEARLNASAAICGLEPQSNFIPVFVVGVPRSGTTLVAELLARRPMVCNRGESRWLAELAQQADLVGNSNRTTLQRAAKTYVTQLRQDDANEMCWFIDKQPLNFRYIDLALTLFPNAKVIHCRRNARDTALSLWMQSFDEEVQGYAYDFDDITLVMRDCERLMERWRDLCGDSIRAVDYETLVHRPDTVISELAAWLDFPPAEGQAISQPASGVSTASAWQVRQPIYARSVGRWRNYTQYLPELLRFKCEDQ
ncbi:MAG: sulfotransferase family protein [Rhodanobacteraceae bacterium]|nr:MAG: sulfotransferase family protein [Rhodanobacteraceae bacterium]